MHSMHLLLGGHVSKVEVHLFALPARYGGLGVSNPVESAPLSCVSSTEGAVVLKDAIFGKQELCVAAHYDAS